MKLVVGLGNPGRKYVGTRHNIGYEIITELARRHAPGMRPKAKFDGEWIETFYKDEKICLLCPLTFMNRSGSCVKPVMDFYKISIDDLLVVCDDFNLATARLRFRPGGSAGGQNGLDDIINRLGSREFSRLRIGIGQPPPQWDVSGYVLGKFDKVDLIEMEKAVLRAADGVETWLMHGISSAMNRYNADVDADVDANVDANVDAMRKPGNQLKPKKGELGETAGKPVENSKKKSDTRPNVSNDESITNQTGENTPEPDSTD